MTTAARQSRTATSNTNANRLICVATRLAGLARRGAQIGMIWRGLDGRLMRVRRLLNG
jgi:hypothetical protein